MPDFHMISGGPRPVAPFSHSVEADGWGFLTGQMSTDPDAPAAPLPEGGAAQSRRVMENLDIVLKGLRLDLGHVVQMRAYLTAFERDYAAFNAAYQTYFPPDRRPERTTIGVTVLAVGALLRDRLRCPEARMSRRWHILWDEPQLTLCRHLPPRFDLRAQTRLPGGDPVRLAHQIRQDIWRRLQSVRGVLAGDPPDRRPAHMLGGDRRRAAALPIASALTTRLEEVLEDHSTRRRWIRHAVYNRSVA